MFGESGGAGSERVNCGGLGREARPIAVEERREPGDVLRHGIDGVEGGVREDALVAEYVELYDVADELLPSGDRYQSLRDGAAIELGLRSFLEEGGFGAFTTSFEDLGELKQLPGLAVQRLMAEGYGFGAEGDWKTAIMLLSLIHI